MPTIELGYGHSSINFEYDAERFVILASAVETSHPLSDVEIGEAFDAPIEGEVGERENRRRDGGDFDRSDFCFSGQIISRITAKDHQRPNEGRWRIQQR